MDWKELLSHVPPLALRTVLLYLTVLLVMRWTGKRTVTAMAPFDLALVIMISEVASIPITELDVDLLHGLVPVLILGGLHVLLTTLNLHYKKVEEFTEGRATLLIQNGRILGENLRRERVSLADLAAALRMQQVSSLDEIEEAWLEPTGGVSVILKKEHRPITPSDLKAGSAAGVDTMANLSLARMERKLQDLLQQAGSSAAPAAGGGGGALTGAGAAAGAGGTGGFGPRWGAAPGAGPAAGGGPSGGGTLAGGAQPGNGAPAQGVAQGAGQCPPAARAAAAPQAAAQEGLVPGMEPYTVELWDGVDRQVDQKPRPDRPPG